MRNIPHFAALRHKDYAYAWGASALGGASTWTFLIASQWFVLEQSDQSAMVGWFTFASMIPFLVASPFGGLLADRIERKRLTIYTQILGVGTVAFAAALSLLGWLELWHLCALAFIAGSCRTTQEASIVSLITNLVPREDLLNAITLNSATRHGSRVIGMSVLIISGVSQTITFGTSEFLIGSIIFGIASIYLIWKVKRSSTGEISNQANLFKGIWEGINYVYARRVVAILIILVAFHCALAMSFDSILPGFTKNRLASVDETMLAVLVVSFGIGSAVGTFLLAGVRNDRQKGLILLTMGISSGISPLLLGFSFDISMAFAATLIMGATESVFMALTATYVQLVTPDRLRGRVTSLYILHAGGVMAFTNLGYGYLADIYNAPNVLIVTGILFLVFFAGMSFSDPVLKSIYKGKDISTLAS
ncbi:MAG: MFS transporter [Dehalococcoidia bacterium]|uniref:Major facilitator superfamily (MFS) profile domain-containing protein n=1 Tax=marine metagenome TaxID=408172 RepID=A0A381QEE2_9ZZZZ|nr:hypothetical protein [Dehalococcoidia bacterium]MCS5648531.1 MFS transporter [Dehalococcoidia bacterium]MEC7913755.1 MFS transporter [Chloroflexota bacterium]HAT21744.1 hypothetical protein [Dehalococcoidia bacterium]HBR64736.1 hypothetical protein [Dehalococcoidia bacterium]